MGGKLFVFQIAGVTCAPGFKNKYFALFFGSAAVFDALGHYQTISRSQVNYLVAKLNSHLSSPDQEKFVFALVQVPGELALQLYQLQLLFVQAGYDLWFPVIGKEGKFVLQVEFFHCRFIFASSAVQDCKITIAGLDRSSLPSTLRDLGISIFDWSRACLRK